MDASNDGLWEWNPLTDELFVSPRAKHLLGVPNGVEIRTHADVKVHGGFHPEDRRRISKTFRSSLAPGSGGFDIEYRVIGPAGEVWWVRSRGKVFPGSLGQPMLLTGSLTDITERKRAEAALLLSEGRYARAMEAAEDGHWEWDVVGDAMFLSARMKEILGFAPDAQFTSRADFFNRQPIHPDDRQRVNTAREACLSGTAPRYEIEYRINPRPGELRWVRLRGKVFRDERGQPLYISASLTDITERKLAREAVRRSEERYALAMEASGEGHWDWNIASDEFYADPQMLALYGFPPGTTFAGRADFLARLPLHPEDRPKWEAAAAAHFAGNDDPHRPGDPNPARTVKRGGSI